ncbi:MAG: hypothetical protein HY974_00795 [Candidatus Kerfeldbacteria bacterium]|nr:hypothetical protein [Candidatus Kerfeldbacteria bacterium]
MPDSKPEQPKALLPESTGERGVVSSGPAKEEPRRPQEQTESLADTAKRIGKSILEKGSQVVKEAVASAQRIKQEYDEAIAKDSAGPASEIKPEVDEAIKQESQEAQTLQAEAESTQQRIQEVVASETVQPPESARGPAASAQEKIKIEDLLQQAEAKLGAAGAHVDPSGLVFLKPEDIERMIQEYKASKAELDGIGRQLRSYPDKSKLGKNERRRLDKDIDGAKNVAKRLAKHLDKLEQLKKRGVATAPAKAQVQPSVPAPQPQGAAPSPEQPPVVTPAAPEATADTEIIKEQKPIAVWHGPEGDIEVVDVLGVYSTDATGRKQLKVRLDQESIFGSLNNEENRQRVAQELGKQAGQEEVTARIKQETMEMIVGGRISDIGYAWEDELEYHAQQPPSTPEQPLAPPQEPPVPTPPSPEQPASPEAKEILRALYELTPEKLAGLTVKWEKFDKPDDQGEKTKEEWKAAVDDNSKKKIDELLAQYKLSPEKRESLKQSLIKELESRFTETIKTQTGLKTSNMFLKGAGWGKSLRTFGYVAGAGVAIAGTRILLNPVFSIAQWADAGLRIVGVTALGGASGYLRSKMIELAAPRIEKLIKTKGEKENVVEEISQKQSQQVLKPETIALVAKQSLQQILARELGQANMAQRNPVEVKQLVQQLGGTELFKDDTEGKQLEALSRELEAIFRAGDRTHERLARFMSSVQQNGELPQTKKSVILGAVAGFIGAASVEGGRYMHAAGATMEALQQVSGTVMGALTYGSMYEASLRQGRIKYRYAETKKAVTIQGERITQKRVDEVAASLHSGLLALDPVLEAKAMAFLQQAAEQGVIADEKAVTKAEVKLAGSLKRWQWREKAAGWVVGGALGFITGSLATYAIRELGLGPTKHGVQPQTTEQPGKGGVAVLPVEGKSGSGAGLEQFKGPAWSEANVTVAKGGSYWSTFLKQYHADPKTFGFEGDLNNAKAVNAYGNRIMAEYAAQEHGDQGALVKVNKDGSITDIHIKSPGAKVWWHFNKQTGALEMSQEEMGQAKGKIRTYEHTSPDGRHGVKSSAVTGVGPEHIVPAEAKAINTADLAGKSGGGKVGAYEWLQPEAGQSYKIAVIAPEAQIAGAAAWANKDLAMIAYDDDGNGTVDRIALHDLSKESGAAFAEYPVSGKHSAADNAASIAAAHKEFVTVDHNIQAVREALPASARSLPPSQQVELMRTAGLDPAKDIAGQNLAGLKHLGEVVGSDTRLLADSEFRSFLAGHHQELLPGKAQALYSDGLFYRQAGFKSIDYDYLRKFSSGDRHWSSFTDTHTGKTIFRAGKVMSPFTGQALGFEVKPGSSFNQQTFDEGWQQINRSSSLQQQDYLTIKNKTGISQETLSKVFQLQARDLTPLKVGGIVNSRLGLSDGGANNLWENYLKPLAGQNGTVGEALAARAGHTQPVVSETPRGVGNVSMEQTKPVPHLVEK